MLAKTVDEDGPHHSEVMQQPHHWMKLHSDRVIELSTKNKDIFEQKLGEK